MQDGWFLVHPGLSDPEATLHGVRSCRQATHYELRFRHGAPERLEVVSTLDR
jgi:hypothetical protein